MSDTCDDVFWKSISQSIEVDNEMTSAEDWTLEVSQAYMGEADPSSEECINIIKEIQKDAIKSKTFILRHVINKKDEALRLALDFAISAARGDIKSVDHRKAVAIIEAGLNECEHNKEKYIEKYNFVSFPYIPNAWYNRK